MASKRPSKTNEPKKASPCDVEVPNGLTQLLEEVALAVLKNNPKDINKFIADYICSKYCQHCHFDSVSQNPPQSSHADSHPNPQSENPQVSTPLKTNGQNSNVPNMKNLPPNRAQNHGEAGEGANLAGAQNQALKNNGAKKEDVSKSHPEAMVVTYTNQAAITESCNAFGEATLSARVEAIHGAMAQSLKLSKEFLEREAKLRSLGRGRNETSGAQNSAGSQIKNSQTPTSSNFLKDDKISNVPFTKNPDENRRDQVMAQRISSKSQNTQTLPSSATRTILTSPSPPKPKEEECQKIEHCTCCCRCPKGLQDQYQNETVVEQQKIKTENGGMKEGSKKDGSYENARGQQSQIKNEAHKGAESKTQNNSSDLRGPQNISKREQSQLEAHESESRSKKAGKNLEGSQNISNEHENEAKQEEILHKSNIKKDELHESESLPARLIPPAKTTKSKQLKLNKSKGFKSSSSKLAQAQNESLDESKSKDTHSSELPSQNQNGGVSLESEKTSSELKTQSAHRKESNNSALIANKESTNFAYNPETDFKNTKLAESEAARKSKNSSLEGSPGNVKNNKLGDEPNNEAFIKITPKMVIRPEKELEETESHEVEKISPKAKSKSKKNSRGSRENFIGSASDAALFAYKNSLFAEVKDILSGKRGFKDSPFLSFIIGLIMTLLLYLTFMVVNKTLRCEYY